RYHRSRLSETYSQIPRATSEYSFATARTGMPINPYSLDEHGFHPDEIPDEEIIGMESIDCIDESPQYLEYRRQVHAQRSARLGNRNELSRAIQHVRDLMAQHLTRGSEKSPFAHAGAKVDCNVTYSGEPNVHLFENFLYITTDWLAMYNLLRPEPHLVRDRIHFIGSKLKNEARDWFDDIVIPSMRDGTRSWTLESLFQAM